MTNTEYRQALKSLGLTIQQAGEWLGVAPATAQRYATNGPHPAAAKAILMALSFGLDLKQTAKREGE